MSCLMPGEQLVGAVLTEAAVRLSVCCEGMSRSSKSLRDRSKTGEQPNTFVAARGGRSAIQQRDDRSPSVVVALMRARAGDAAGEEQAARFVVKKRLARRRRAEPARFRPVIVAHDRHVGKGGGGPPQIALRPLVGKALGLQKEHVGLRPNRRARQRFGELGEARARARALRMRQQNQRRPVVGSSKSRVGGPFRGSRRAFPGRVIVAQRTASPAAAPVNQRAVTIHPQRRVRDSIDAGLGGANSSPSQSHGAYDITTSTSTLG